MEIHFSKTKAEIAHFLQEKEISSHSCSKTQIVVKSKLFSLDIEFLIAFKFSGEKMVAITISPNRVIEGGALHSRYKEIQKALEKELGHPHNWPHSVINWLDPYNRLSGWRSNGIQIEHYLFDRFGIEEIVDIKLYKDGGRFA